MRKISRILGVAVVLVGASAAGALADSSMRLDQVPAAVKMTIEKTVANGKLEEIEKEVRTCDTVFEVEFKDVNGKDFELLIAEDGKLLSNKRD